jgi:hypothetical protein
MTNQNPEIVKLPEQKPVILELNSVSEAKMEAIKTVADALLELSKAINGTNTSFSFSDINISGVSQGPAISVNAKGL